MASFVKDCLIQIAAQAPESDNPRRSSVTGLLPIMEDAMGRKFIDCRAFPSEMNCTVTIIADTEAELLDAAVQHAVAVHGHQDSPELRDQLRAAIRDGIPSEAASSRAA